MNVEIWHVDGTRFHFGRHGLGQEKTSTQFPSDSLFAALVARLVALHGASEAKAFSNQFRSDAPPFVLSSAFPRAGEILFFPPPKRLDPLDEADDGPKPKKLKNVHYVSENVFRALLAGSTLAEQWKQCEKLQDDSLMLTTDEFKKLPEEIQDGREALWDVHRQPRVTIERRTNASAIYHTGQIVFNRGCGLWFGLRWLKPNSELESQLSELFLELGHAGLGGERSSGFGVCKITQKGSIQLPGASGQPWVSLSRYLPRENEMTALRDPHASYKIESVEGWVQSAYEVKDERRKTVHILAEGSVFGPLETESPGQIVDAQPSYNGTKPLGHEVWRNGIALGVGLGTGG